MTSATSSNTATTAAIDASATRLRAALGSRQPRIAAVLGSGWGGVADALQDPVAVPYAELPAFPVLAIAGHAGEVKAGRLEGIDVLLLCGRKHVYEHGDAAAMAGAIRTLKALGVSTLVLTNAAGSLDVAMPTGSLMLLTDHLNLVQQSPLVGETGSARFVNMQHAYDPHLLSRARLLAARRAMPLYEGIYAWQHGPQFETPAEIRMLQRLGAHAVGMSTVPETILARHAGLKVLGLSLITNLGCGLADETLSHEQTLAASREAATVAVPFLAALLPALAEPA
jgi:purine-nucleoside phosphorylase